MKKFNCKKKIVFLCVFFEKKMCKENILYFKIYYKKIDFLIN